MRVLLYSTGIVCNELICGYANMVHTSSSFCPCTHTCMHAHARTHTHACTCTHTHTHTHTHTLSLSLILSEDCEPMGLKVDICKGLVISIPESSVLMCLLYIRAILRELPFLNVCAIVMYVYVTVQTGISGNAGLPWEKSGCEFPQSNPRFPSGNSGS